MINNLWFATILTFFIAIMWLRMVDFLSHNGYISSRISRKIIHIGTGPIFVLCWLLFPEDPLSRFLAALIPFSIVIQFSLTGLGIIKDQASVQAMSRNGNRREILFGPLFYGLVFIIITIVYWRDSVIGILALMIMCGGDGLADIVGNLGQNKYYLPWSSQKTVSGSIAMFVGGFCLSIGIVFIFSKTGTLPNIEPRLIFQIIVITVICTIIESLPFKDVDNLTVPAGVVILGHILSLG